MRRARKSDDSDPMELLLDTVSNVFGGVMFLTLLAALLTISRGGSALETREEDQIDSNQDLTLAVEYESLRLNMDELDFSLETQARLLAEMSPPENFDAQLAQLEQVQNGLAQTQQQLNQTKKDIESQRSQKEQMELGLRPLEQKLVALQSEMESKVAELEEIENQYSRKVTFSLLREAETSNSVVLMLRYGKLYRLTDSPSSSGFREEDIEVLEDFDRVAILPRKEGGVKMSVDTLNQTMMFVSKFQKTSYYVTIAVWDDSFVEFNMLRNQLVADGYKYRTLICTDESILNFGGAINQLVQ